MKPAVGSPAPLFTADVVGGDFTAPAKLSLRACQGHPVVLYFYPKDDTPGCTAQACGLRDGWEDIKAKAKVFGISPDSIASHQKFLKKHSLPFALISDGDHAIAEAYGVWVEKSMYGKKYLGVERSTFVIGVDGQVAAVFPKVQPAEHLAKVLAVL